MKLEDLMRRPVQIELLPYGIRIITYDDYGPHRVDKSVGEYWLVGAVDQDAYPYEVLITVVTRQGMIGDLPRRKQV